MTIEPISVWPGWIEYRISPSHQSVENRRPHGHVSMCSHRNNKTAGLRSWLHQCTTVTVTCSYKYYHHCKMMASPTLTLAWWTSQLVTRGLTRHSWHVAHLWWQRLWPGTWTLTSSTSWGLRRVDLVSVICTQCQLMVVVNTCVSRVPWSHHVVNHVSETVWTWTGTILITFTRAGDLWV